MTALQDGLRVLQYVAARGVLELDGDADAVAAPQERKKLTRMHADAALYTAFVVGAHYMEVQKRGLYAFDEQVRGAAEFGEAKKIDVFLGQVKDRVRNTIAHTKVELPQLGHESLGEEQQQRDSGSNTPSALVEAKLAMQSALEEWLGSREAAASSSQDA